MNMRLIAVLSCIAVLNACDGSQPRDVPYYKAHDDERLAKIAQCDRDPGHLDLSPNCRNAHEAETQKAFNPNNRRTPSL